VVKGTIRIGGYLPQLIVAAALWGSASASSKLAVAAVPPLVAAGIRFTVGAVVLLAVTRLFAPAKGGNWRAAAIAGVVGVFIYNAFYFWALTFAPSVDGSVIVPAMSAILTCAMTSYSVRSKPSRVRLCGLATGLAGGIAFVAGSSASAGDARLLGDVIFLGCAVIWTAYTLLGQRITVSSSPLQASAHSMAAGAVPLVLLAAPGARDVSWPVVPLFFWINMLYLVAGPTVAASLLYYQSIRRVGADTVALSMFMVPVFGAICSTLLLQESMSAIQAAGAVAMLAGAIAAATEGRFLGASVRREVRA
jgi:drug/metabolite transporter (DMT)-like permease